MLFADFHLLLTVICIFSLASLLTAFFIICQQLYRIHVHSRDKRRVKHKPQAPNKWALWQLGGKTPLIHPLEFDQNQRRFSKTFNETGFSSKSFNNKEKITIKWKFWFGESSKWEVSLNDQTGSPSWTLIVLTNRKVSQHVSHDLVRRTSWRKKERSGYLEGKKNNNGGGEDSLSSHLQTDCYWALRSESMLCVP